MTLLLTQEIVEQRRPQALFLTRGWDFDPKNPSSSFWNAIQATVSPTYATEVCRPLLVLLCLQCSTSMMSNASEPFWLTREMAPSPLLNILERSLNHR